MNLNILYIVATLMIIPCLIYGLVSQTMISSTFEQFSTVPSQANLTGGEVAERLLKRANINNVDVVKINGKLTDNYNSKFKVIKLSTGVYSSISIASIGVAAHETGHAIQDHTGMFWFRLKTLISPVLSIISRISIPLILFGSILDMALMFHTIGYYIVLVSVIAYGASMILTFLSLPLEYDASKRALKMLKEENILTESELKDTKKVLRAALHTYISSFMTSLVYFLRLLILLFMYASDRKR